MRERGRVGVGRDRVRLRAVARRDDEDLGEPRLGGEGRTSRRPSPGIAIRSRSASGAVWWSTPDLDDVHAVSPPPGREEGMDEREVRDRHGRRDDVQPGGDGPAHGPRATRQEATSARPNWTRGEPELDAPAFPLSSRAATCARGRATGRAARADASEASRARRSRPDQRRALRRVTARTRASCGGRRRGSPRRAARPRRWPPSRAARSPCGARTRRWAVVGPCTLSLASPRHRRPGEHGREQSRSGRRRWRCGSWTRARRRGPRARTRGTRAPGSPSGTGSAR